MKKKPLKANAKYGKKAGGRPVVLMGLVIAIMNVVVPRTEAAPISGSLSINTIDLEAAPTVLRFKGRLMQARIPVGDTELREVSVEILNGFLVECRALFPTLHMKDSVLDLEMTDLSCGGGKRIEEILLTTPAAKIRVCIGGNCTAEVPLAATPYATKANIAGNTQTSSTAEIAARSHYAHGFSSSLSMLTSGMAGAGVIDTASPDGTYAPGANDIYTDYVPHFQEGFISWWPQSIAGTRALNVCSKDTAGQLGYLSEFVVHASETSLQGHLDVIGSPVGLPGAKLVGNATTNADVEVTFGDVGVHTGQLSMGDPLDPGLTAADDLGGSLTVTNGHVRAAALNSENTTAITLLQTDADLLVGDAVGELPGAECRVSGETTFIQDVAFGNSANASTASVYGGVLVSNSSVHNAGDEFTCGINAQHLAQTHYASVVVYDGPVTFNGPVVFPDTQPPAADGVKNSAIRDEAVDSRSILDGSVIGEDLANGTLNTSKFNDGIKQAFVEAHWGLGWDVERSGVGPIRCGDNVCLGRVDSSPGTLMRTVNGGAWQADVTTPTSLSDAFAAGGPGEWVAIGTDGTVYWSTDDGENWVASGNAGAGVDFVDVIYADNTWVALGTAQNSTPFYYYPVVSVYEAGVGWSVSTVVPISGHSLYAAAIAYDGIGNWVAVGNCGGAYNEGFVAHTSTLDGSLWSDVTASIPGATTKRYWDVEYGNGVFVAVGSVSATSRFGMEWQPTTPSFGCQACGAGYNAVDGWVIVGGAVILQSDNGDRWKQYRVNGSITDIATDGTRWYGLQESFLISPGFVKLERMTAL